jgi:hypothetical protein
MTHPFFSPVRYPLHLALAKELFDSLIRFYDTAARARFVVDIVGIDATRIAWERMHDAWYEILNESTKSRLLERLLGQILADDKAASLHDVVRRVLTSNDVDGLLSMLDSPLLPGDQPFLDRANLRSRLRQLAPRAPVAPSMLVVRGEPGTGKTTTRLLIMALADGLRDPVIYFDEGNARDVARVASKILKKLDPTAGPLDPSYTTSDAAYQRYWEEALDRAAGQRLWVIVDDVGPDVPGADEGAASIDRSVLAFFHKLAELLTRYPNEYATSFRLVLLDYHAAINRPPTKVNKDFLREDVTEALTAGHVGPFVETVWRSRNKQFSKADVEVATGKRVADAEARAEDGRACRAQALRDVLSDWVARQEP